MLSCCVLGLEARTGLLLRHYMLRRGAAAAGCWLLLLRGWRVHNEVALGKLPLAINVHQPVLNNPCGNQGWWVAGNVQDPISCNLCCVHTIRFNHDVAGQVSLASGNRSAFFEILQDGHDTLHCGQWRDDLCLINKIRAKPLLLALVQCHIKLVTQLHDVQLVIRTEGILCKVCHTEILQLCLQ